MNAEIRRKVHYLDPGVQQRAGHVHGRTGGHCQKDQIAVPGGFPGLENADDHIRARHVLQKRIKLAQAFARLGSGAGHAQAHGGVSGQQPRQFHARIAGNAHQAHIDRIHAACPCLVSDCKKSLHSCAKNLCRIIGEKTWFCANDPGCARQRPFRMPPSLCRRPGRI